MNADSLACRQTSDEREDEEQHCEHQPTWSDENRDPKRAVATRKLNDDPQVPPAIQGHVLREPEGRAASWSGGRAPVMPTSGGRPAPSSSGAPVNQISHLASRQSNQQQQQQQRQASELRPTKSAKNCDRRVAGSNSTCRMRDSGPREAADHQAILASSQVGSNQAPAATQWAVCRKAAGPQEGHGLSSSSFLFWNFLSNLPKSITQRGRPTGALTPEVAGYLASKQADSGPSGRGEQVALGGGRPADSSMSFEGGQPGELAGERKCAGHRLIKITAPRSSQRRPETYNEREEEEETVEDDEDDEEEEEEEDDDEDEDEEDDEDERRGAAPVRGKRAGKLSAASSSSSSSSHSSGSSLSSCVLSSSSDDQARIRWSKKMDFLLSIIGFAVDLANIWRFPYLVYKNGGGVFLIPYVIMLIFGGIPLFFLELCLGQFVKKGPITVWNKICPAMKGVGYCSIMISWYVSFYYNVLIAWSVYFIYRSLLSIGDKMPWEDCDNSWNSKDTCVSISHLKTLCSTNATRNETLESCRRDIFAAVNVTSPASEFFVKELSQIDQSTGLDDMGFLRPELVLCTMVVYTLHYFSLFRGLETSGKVVWVTATAPYMILSILLIRGLFLPGAAMGIEYYLSPRLEKLADPQVWIDAAGQVFYSIGVGFGVHLTYASFNSHNNDCYRDCLMTSAVNAATSVYSGLVVFVYLGYMAQNLGIEIDKVASEGYSLVFEVYPEALTTLPFARFWSILFFIMLLTLGIDSAMGGLEAVITGLEDEFKFARRLSRGQLTGLVIVSSFLPALISCTQGGAYTLFWFDIYSAGVSLLFSALFETIGVVYCYGLDKFITNIESMLGKKPNIFYIICWKYISPCFLGVVIFMSIYTATVPTYRGYTFPLWSVRLGWCLAFSSVAAVPTMAIWHWYKLRKRDKLATLKLARRKDRATCDRGSGGKKTPNHHSTSVSYGRSHAHSGLTTTTTILTESRDLSPTIGDGLSCRIGEEML